MGSEVAVQVNFAPSGGFPWHRCRSFAEGWPAVVADYVDATLARYLRLHFHGNVGLTVLAIVVGHAQGTEDILYVVEVPSVFD